MMVHKIKLREEFADAVLSGEKNFEIRENDRGYQKGDEIHFRVVDEAGFAVNHKLSHTGVKYEITYVLSGWGIKDGCVVFGIRRKETNNTEVTETCPWCEAENTYPGWDVEKDGYIAICKTCGKKIFLCDECQHATDCQPCDWRENIDILRRTRTGQCFRGCTENKAFP